MTYSLSPKVRELVSISSPALCDQPPQLPEDLIRVAGAVGNELSELLHKKNGFYAFESALHVLPSDCSTAVMNLEYWNADGLWRNGYGDMITGCVFFAEDVFGAQFVLRDGKVHRFDPESGNTEQMGNSLEDWAGKILDDYEYETGYPLAHEWQKSNGPLTPGKRLIPKVPFMLGGEYSVQNLYELDAVEAMRLRADTWKQMKDLPDGAQVRLEVVD